MKKDIKEIALEIAKVVEMKNNDYNYAFAKGVDEFGYYEYLVALGHKYRRIKSLTVENNEQLVNESVEDTLIDIVGYTLNMIKYIRDKGDDEIANQSK